MREPLHFLTAGDAGVAWGIAASVGSVLRHTPKGTPFTITVIDGGLPPGLCERLGATAKRMRPDGVLRFVPFRWPEGCAAPALEGSRVAYARLFAPEVVEGDFCLYFDADTVLCEDPAPLFAEARAHPGTPVWAARNYPQDRWHFQLGRQSPAWLDGVPAEHPYFNSGLLMINCREWRRRDVARQGLELAARHQFIAHDQDALNVLFRDEWRELPERWNYQLYERYAFPAGVALLHYSGRNKPWHFGYPAEPRRPFVEALGTAGWARWRPSVNFKQWLRNSPLRPAISHAQYSLRRAMGLRGVKRR